MILPSQTIKNLCKPENSSTIPALIQPFLNDNLRASSYDLTVGSEYYIGQKNSASTLSVEQIKIGQTFTIPPHAVCFILAAESINLPNNVTAKVSLRMTHIYAGLVLPAQPPFDPRYRGKVIVMVHNLSSDAVHMKSGDRLVTIEFMRVQDVPELEKPHRSVTNLADQLSKPIVSSLTEIANISNSANSRVTWLAGQMIAFVALIVASLAIPGLFSFNSLSERIKDQDAKLEKMSAQIEGYKSDFEINNKAIINLKDELQVLTKKSNASEFAGDSSRRVVTK